MQALYKLYSIKCNYHAIDNHAIPLRHSYAYVIYMVPHLNGPINGVNHMPYGVIGSHSVTRYPTTDGDQVWGF